MTNGDTNISTGDLVMVVKPSPCCGHTRDVGVVFVVKAVEMLIKVECCDCGALLPVPMRAAIQKLAVGRYHGDCFPLSLLQKIKPPPVKQAIDKPEELEAVL
jgi:hypothetical protein